MDNEAPNYASWMPEAGGYVANGKVVSKSPMYDEAGKLRLDVDASLFGGTASQPNTAKAQPQVANNPLSNNGITTANTTGSGEDVNSMETKLGSMGSLNLNTENPQESVLSTPASKSPSAGEPILTPVQQAMKELQDATARGTDFQAMINAYTKLGRLTGEDYSAEIADLTQKRQQKIENIDNDYASQIATAMMRGDTEEVARLKAEQSSWRNSVGYQDAMANKFEQARQEIDTDYQTTFWDGIRDIAGMVAQSLPGILNFQYDPMQDQNLLRAQSLIEMRARNRASQTGMYYSSTTQYAISQACANLIPIYQKMAKEEAIQNFQLLQQTASFLVDLEQAQFNLWKGQLDMKFQANADKRAEIAAAWDKVNQLGYVDNETSAILGIPAGTESYATRKAYVDKLNQVDEENRKLEQDLIVLDYQQALALEKMKAQQALDVEEYAQRAAIDYSYDKALEEQKTADAIRLQQVKNQGGSGGSGSKKTAKYDVDGLISYYNSLAGLLSEEELDALLYDAAATEADYLQATARIARGDTQTEADKKATNALTNLSDSAKTIGNLELKTSLNDLIGKGFDKVVMARTIDSWLNNSAYSESDVEKAIEELALINVYDKLDNEKGNFGKNFKSTDEALKNSIKTVEDFADMLNETNWEDKNAGIYTVYKGLVDRINGAKEFDNSRWALMFDDDNMQKSGVQSVLKSLSKNTNLGGKSGVPYALLSSYVATGEPTTKTNRENLKLNTPKINSDLNGVTTKIKQNAFEKVTKNNNLQ